MLSQVVRTSAAFGRGHTGLHLRKISALLNPCCSRSSSRLTIRQSCLSSADTDDDPPNDPAALPDDDAKANTSVTSCSNPLTAIFVVRPVR